MGIDKFYISRPCEASRHQECERSDCCCGCHMIEDVEHAQEELTDLLNLDDGLTTWEVKFLESLNKQSSLAFTEKQMNKLHQIWNRLIGDPDTRTRGEVKADESERA